jgi:hypothetical protein
MSRVTILKWAKRIAFNALIIVVAQYLIVLFVCTF